MVDLARLRLRTFNMMAGCRVGDGQETEGSQQNDLANYQEMAPVSLIQHSEVTIL